MIDSTWKAKKNKITNKIETLKTRGHHTYSILQKYPPKNKKKRDFEVWLTDRLKSHNTQNYLEWNKQKPLINLTDHIFENREIELMENNSKCVWTNEKDALLNLIVKQNNVAKKIVDTTIYASQNKSSIQPAIDPTKITKKLYKNNNFTVFQKTPNTLKQTIDKMSITLNDMLLIDNACGDNKKDNNWINNLQNSLSKDFIFIKADKGGSNVVMKREDYDLQTQIVLENPILYTKVAKNPTETLNRKLIKYLGSLKNNETISKTTYDYVRCSTPRIPVFKIYPKIHKNPTSYRPVVDSFDSFNYYLAKYLVSILKKYDDSINTQIKNSTTLKNEILFLPPTTYSNFSMASLDIVALYPSINRGDAIDQLLKLYDQDENQTTNIPTQTMRELLGWATVSIFNHNGQIYKQRNGLSMGSPISSILANVYINQVIENHPHFNNDKIVFYKRYMDDTLLLWKGDQKSFEEHVNNLNKITDNIQFTSEFESNQSINFLDLNINRQPDTDFTFKFHKKDYAVINPINWKSLHPPKMKMGIFKGYTHRILNATSIKSDIIKTITFLIFCFHLRGYPIHMLLDSTYRAINNKGKTYCEWLLNDLDTTNINLDSCPRDTKTPHNSDPQDSQLLIYAPMNYVPFFSDVITKKWKNALKPQSTKIIFSQRPMKNTLTTILSRSNNRDSDKGLIYGAICKQCPPKSTPIHPNTHTTKFDYIGETGRTLQNRIKEHESNSRDNNSAIRNHIDTTGHNDIAYEIILKECDTFTRKIWENKIITKCKPTWNTSETYDSYLKLDFDSIIKMHSVYKRTK